MTLTQLRCHCQSLAVTLYIVLLVGSSPCQAGSGGTIKLPTATNKKVKKRKYYYMYSQREIFNDMRKPVSEGGLNLLETKEGVLDLSFRSFGKCIPDNLKCMTQSQKVMLGCETCIDAATMHSALMEFRNRCLKIMNSLLKEMEAQLAVES